jgi:hypothetical protein
VHTHCHDPNLDHLKRKFRHDIWRCHDCKPCSVCENDGDVAKLLICDSCDRSFHTFCVGMDIVPDGDDEWFCTECKDLVEEPAIEPQFIDSNAFFDEDDDRIDDALLSEDVELELEPTEFSQKLNNIYMQKQELLQDEMYVRQLVEEEGLYSPKELQQQEEALQALLSKFTTEEDRARERKTREIFLGGASRDFRNKLIRIRTFHIRVSNQEIKQALAVIKDEEEIIRRLMAKNSYSFLQTLRRKLAEPQKVATGATEAPKAEEDEESEYEDDDSDDEEFVHVQVKKPRGRKKGARKGHHSVPRLLLNDALADDDMSNWSEARKTAYAKSKTKPNSYYYRFNAPGEKQRNGPFSKEEKALFLKRLKEFDFSTDNPQWGIFSQAIPGRVGYQCSSKN